MLHGRLTFGLLGGREADISFLVQATLSLSRQPVPPSMSNMTREQYIACVEKVKDHIQAGDIFQLVLSHRFKRRTFADPFEVYRCGGPFLISAPPVYRRNMIHPIAPMTPSSEFAFSSAAFQLLSREVYVGSIPLSAIYT